MRCLGKFIFAPLDAARIIQYMKQVFDTPFLRRLIIAFPASLYAYTRAGYYVEFRKYEISITLSHALNPRWEKSVHLNCGNKRHK